MSLLIIFSFQFHEFFLIITFIYVRHLLQELLNEEHSREQKEMPFHDNYCQSFPHVAVNLIDLSRFAISLNQVGA